MAKDILTISQESFSKFGKVIELEETFNERFKIIIQEEEQPWRIAIYRYNEKTIEKFENHPYSMESFEPLTGTTLIAVAENNKPEDYKVFLLDEASVKITENLEVTSEFYHLENEIKPQIV